MALKQVQFFQLFIEDFSSYENGSKLKAERSHQIHRDPTIWSDESMSSDLPASEADGQTKTSWVAEIFDRNDSGRFGEPLACAEFGVDGALQDDDVAGGDLLHVWRDGSPDVEDDEVVEGRIRSSQNGFRHFDQLNGGGVVAHRNLVRLKPGNPKDDFYFTTHSSMNHHHQTFQGDIEATRVDSQDSSPSSDPWVFL